jgi:hypothetical protein
MKARVQTVSPEDEFIAANEAGVAVETQTLNDNAEEISPNQFKQVGGARVEHTGPGLVRLYKRSAYGWNPVEVPSNRLKMLLQGDGKGNYRTSCGDCQKNDCEGRCPESMTLQYRLCPVPSCRKKVYDSPPTDERKVEEAPGQIEDETYVKSTPETRTQAKLDAHMFHYHPTEMTSLAPDSSRNPVRSPLPGRLDERA